MQKKEIEDWCSDNGYVLVKEVLGVHALPEKQIVEEGLQGILSRVAKMAELTQAQLLTPGREERFMLPRQIAHAAAAKHLPIARSEIARVLGGFHRTTINCSETAVKRLIATDKYYRYHYGPILELYDLCHV